MLYKHNEKTLFISSRSCQRVRFNVLFGQLPAQRAGAKFALLEAYGLVVSGSLAMLNGRMLTGPLLK
jgi:hypothetical protein